MEKLAWNSHDDFPLYWGTKILPLYAHFLFFWSKYFLKELIHLSLSKLKPNGVSCWNVGKVGSTDMNVDVLSYHKSMKYDMAEEFKVVSSKRQAINKTKNSKSEDTTVIYKMNASMVE